MNEDFDKKVFNAIKKGFSANKTIMSFIFNGNDKYYRPLDRSLQRLRKKKLIIFKYERWIICQSNYDTAKIQAGDGK